MKRKPIFLAAFTVVAFTVGCKPANDGAVNPAEPAAESAAAKLDQARQETKEAVQATKDYAYAQKTEFVETMRAQLADLNKEMEELAAKVETSTGVAKEEAAAKLQALREKTAGLNQKLEEVGNATESTWAEVKTGFKKAYDETKKSINEARQWLSEKISP